MNPVHNASLVEASYHSKEVLQLLDLDINRTLIDHLVQETAEAVDYSLGKPATSRGRSDRRSKKRPDFGDFIANVLSTADVKMATILVTLVYIHRSKSHLSIETEEWAHHRVFLGALILASKYTNDSTLKNSHWAIATGLFGKRDIGRIEREFLDVLDWQLGVSESDILGLHDSLMASYPLRRSPRSPKRLIPSVKTIFSRFDSGSEHSSPASSPAPSTPSTSSPPRHSGLRKAKSIKDIAMHISHTLSIPWASDLEERSVSPSYPHSLTA
ncbi:hypothetical protein BJ322DRAFT_129376 [Thelephora terrestris]|uniref:Cyclin N-terminal domain-containing protein n=1 Tax=Thelephora terrestris TaxID=56493 RepID=A0A9P6HRK0_9AGAM|nr:hypothetical protein BJ322DRAFT_129376 [Thelephora terrestris]